MLNATMSNFPSWLSAFAALATVVTASLAARASRRAAQATEKANEAHKESRHADQQSRLYELARSLHEDLTTGHVQEARHILGSCIYSGTEYDTNDVVNAYFRLLWCFERINAGRKVIEEAEGADNTAMTFFTDLMAWHLEEWRDNFTGSDHQICRKINDELDGGLNDEDAWKGFQELHNSLRPDDPIDHWKK